ncbi:unnamed protein product [Arabidopsis lyrata]|nr:unnamed protein product [Arabidopsis lyrata]
MEWMMEMTSICNLGLAPSSVLTTLFMKVEFMSQTVQQHQKSCIFVTG